MPLLGSGLCLGIILTLEKHLNVSGKTYREFYESIVLMTAGPSRATMYVRYDSPAAFGCQIKVHH